MAVAPGTTWGALPGGGNNRRKHQHTKGKGEWRSQIGWSVQVQQAASTHDLPVFSVKNTRNGRHHTCSWWHQHAPGWRLQPSDGTKNKQCDMPSWKWQKASWALTLFSPEQVMHLLHKPSQTTDHHGFHPAKISNLFPCLAIHKPKGKAMKQHQQHCLWLQAMLHKMPLFSGKPNLIVFVHSKSQKHSIQNSQSLNSLIICNWLGTLKNQVAKKSEEVTEIDWQQKSWHTHQTTLPNEIVMHQLHDDLGACKKDNNQFVNCIRS